MQQQQQDVNFFRSDGIKSLTLRFCIFAARMISKTFKATKVFNVNLAITEPNTTATYLRKEHSQYGR
jgi:hypothetical protein